MQSTRFDFDVISGPVPPRIPPQGAPTVPPTANQTTKKPETGK